MAKILQIPRSAPLRQAIPGLIEKWEHKLEVSVPRWSIRRMKTKWGSCNRETRHIWFNVELAKKYPDCLEYIIVHEMAHYFERNHGERFIKLMDHYLPRVEYSQTVAAVYRAKVLGHKVLRVA